MSTTAKMTTDNVRRNIFIAAANNNGTVRDIEPNRAGRIVEAEIAFKVRIDAVRAMADLARQFTNPTFTLVEATDVPTSRPVLIMKADR